MENIRYGWLDATNDEVIAAASLANADHCIRRLPHGCATLLSERAGNLSEGAAGVVYGACRARRRRVYYGIVGLDQERDHQQVRGMIEMNTVAIGLDEKTAHELAQLARVRAVEPSALAGEAIRTYLRSEARHAMEQEAEAFRRLHPDLRATIPGQYAAIYQGQLVDHDVDQLALFQRIEARFGGLPVLIRQVRPEIEQTINVLSLCCPISI
jgi:post-segregation antitoxin (ccd killing protein)